MKSGLLLINLGTPEALNLAAVKRYLREFLSDKRVIDVPWLIRALLVHGLIIPFRAKKSLHAYSTIWSSTQGSPLLYLSQQLVRQIQQDADADTKVILAMRYGAPSIESGLAELKDCSSITILPLYPQYSSAANGSSIEKTVQIIKNQEVIPSLKIISHFFQHPSYIQAQAEFIKMHLNPESHLLFSYHGIPERQIHKSGCKKLCPNNCAINNQNCYRSQCYQTSDLLAQALYLSSDQYSTSFQSRLGKTPWIKPYTDELLKNLAKQGIKHLTITCPSFVTDCLETLEEIGIQAREQWLQLGGQQFTLIPAMNHYSSWAKAILNIAELH